MSRTVPEARRREIEELAEQVVDDFAPSGPISPEHIIRKLGIRCIFGRYGDSFDGLLEYRSGRFNVFCNLDRAGRRDAPRARFTLAHELGHYFIDEHRQVLQFGAAAAHPSFCEYESVNLVEQEADLFASNLLLPSQRFFEGARRARPGLPAIIELARQFGTSITATAIRYAQLDILPCALVKWNPDSFSWKWLSTETFRSRYIKTVESVDDLPKDCATREALEGAALPALGFFRRGSTASSWFPRVPSAGDRNVIFIEEALPLGRFGVLTFLYPADGAYRT